MSRYIELPSPRVFKPSVFEFQHKVRVFTSAGTVSWELVGLVGGESVSSTYCSRFHPSLFGVFAFSAYFYGGIWSSFCRGSFWGELNRGAAGGRGVCERIGKWVWFDW